MKHVIKKFESQLSRLSNEELVVRFNAEVGKRGWVSARAYFLEALSHEFAKRNIDYALIQNETGGLNLGNKVQLSDGKLIF